MKKEVYGVYHEEQDITFIMEDTLENDVCISTELKGFYYGPSNMEDTKTFYGKMKADFTS